MTSADSLDKSLATAPSEPIRHTTLDGSRGSLWIYSLAIFLSAFLLFQVQPLIGKFVLPWFGGTPSVWTTCMLFFQLLLFGGYAYAHLTTRWLAPRNQSIVHGILLAAACLLLPIIPSDSLKPLGTEEPVSRIVLVLGLTVGAPFFVLSATGPLLQGWFSRTHRNRSPYRLYALSNVGSLLALVTFPSVFDWLLPTKLLAWMWSICFMTFAVLCGICAWASAGRDSLAARDDSSDAAVRPPRWGTWLLWFALAMVPSVLLLATTNQVCLDVAPVPFLWVLPLTLYLLSFILCFDSDRWYSRRVFIPGMMVALACVCYALYKGHGADLTLQLAAYFGVLFFCAMVCHGELVRRKPDVRHLTSFYLVISAGGAAGGIFVGIIAPLTFTGYYELHIGLFACALLIVVVLALNPERLPFNGPGMVIWPLLLIAVVLLGLDLSANALQEEQDIRLVRNFYGVLRVKKGALAYGKGDERRMLPTYELWNGRIRHGFQYLDPDLRRVAGSYYASASGVGRALSLPSDHPRRVGLVGLGTGTLATYARPGDLFRFYEINSKVEEIARKDFTFLADCKGEVQIIRGDARLNLAREQPQSFDVLVLDAFSGDAVPVHLLTREAFEIYLPHMAPDGIIAVHISNRHFALAPVVLALADFFHLATATIATPRSPSTGASSSVWVLVSASAKALQARRIRNASLKNNPTGRVLWTDDHASLFEVWLLGWDDLVDRGAKEREAGRGGGMRQAKPKTQPENE
jgi:spermidine synthase